MQFEVRAFEQFPEDKTCPVCGTSKQEPCCLIEIQGTPDDGICEAIPVHVSCVLPDKMLFNKEVGAIYTCADK